MRIAGPLLCLVLIAALPAGCGSSSDDGGTGASAQACHAHMAGAQALRATGVSCREARRVREGWQRSGGCAPGAGASRDSCTVQGFRCLAAVTDRGTAVSCATKGRSVAFVAGRG